MNKKEISEIRKQLTPQNCAVTRIAGCYVDGEKNKVTRYREAFLSLPEEESFKYFEIFRKVLSGSLGRNLFNMDFPLETEKEGRPQNFLLQLRDSELRDEGLLDQYYDKIIENYGFNENYLILVIHCTYDVPGKAKDNREMFDASEEVFNFQITAVCPVALAKPALTYDPESQEFHERIRDWIVDMPTLGFMFPCFNDRSADIHSVLFYSKNPKDLHSELTDPLLGCSAGLTATDQKEVFTQLVEETLGDSCDFDTVRSIHEKLHEITEEAKNSPDPPVLDQSEVKNLFAMAGADNEKMAFFDEHYEHAAGENTEFVAANIASSRKFEVKTPDVVISVSPDRADLVEQKVIDGRPCLVIPITDTVEVNGIMVTGRKPAETEQGKE